MFGKLIGVDGDVTIQDIYSCEYHPNCTMWGKTAWIRHWQDSDGFWHEDVISCGC